MKDTHDCFLFILCGKSSSALENANAEASMDSKVRRAQEEMRKTVPNAHLDDKLGHLELHGNCREAEEQNWPNSNLINQWIIYLSLYLVRKYSKI